MLRYALIALLASALALPASVPAAVGPAHPAKAKCKKKRASGATSSRKKKRCKRPAPTTVPGGDLPASPVASDPGFDSTPPALAILSPTAVTGPDGTVIYSTGDATTVQCQLDSAPVVCAGGTYDFTLPGGPHTFRIDGFDAAGNTAFVSVTWTVDASPPIVHSTAVGGTASTPQVDFTLSDLSTISDVRCVLDGAPSTSCGSGTMGSVSYAGLMPGMHTLDIHGIDVWDNAGSGAPAAAPAQVARVMFTVS